MSEFDASETRPCITVPTMLQVETTAAVPCAPDFIDEKTLERAICWKHGDYWLNDKGERVRAPVYAETCVQCKEGSK